MIVFDASAALRVQRYGHLALATRIWDLRENATAYDAAYLALAEALPGTLLTCDAALASVLGICTRVEVVRITGAQIAEARLADG